MKFAAHGDYEIELDGRILKVRVKETVNSEMMQQYSRDMDERVAALSGRPFATYLEYLTDAVLMQEAAETLRPRIVERQRHGLCAVALNVSGTIAPSIVTAKSRDLYESLGMPWQRFEDYGAARSWLLKQVAMADEDTRAD